MQYNYEDNSSKIKSTLDKNDAEAKKTVQEAISKLDGYTRSLENRDLYVFKDMLAKKGIILSQSEIDIIVASLDKDKGRQSPDLQQTQENDGKDQKDEGLEL